MTIIDIAAGVFIGNCLFGLIVWAMTSEHRTGKPPDLFHWLALLVACLFVIGSLADESQRKKPIGSDETVAATPAPFPADMRP